MTQNVLRPKDYPCGLSIMTIIPINKGSQRGRGCDDGCRIWSGVVLKLTFNTDTRDAGSL